MAHDSDSITLSDAVSLNRRSFLKRSTAAVAGAIAVPYIIPASALGADGHVAPSNRLVMGCIGVGSQGTGNMKGFLAFPEVQVVAVCDVDRSHRESAQETVNQTYSTKDCAGYNDFRELIDRDDLDVLSIAVPDHWHAIPAIAGAQRGLDIYAEKPLALTIREGQAMVNAIKRHGTIWQTGSWQRSRANFHRGAELVRNGRIGQVHTVEVGLPTGKGIDPQPEMPIPDGFDYDFWLGPAPEAPYTEERCHWDFRWIFDYSGGQLTDWAAHHCDIANWGMGTEYTGPVSVKGKGEFPEDGIWNTAINYMLECTFAPGASPVAPQGFTMFVSNSFPMGCRWKGSEGELFVDRGDVIQANPAAILDSVIGADEVHLYRSEDHAQNFFDGVRARKQCVAPIEPAHRAISIAHLGNIAMRLGREVKWDPAAENVVNDPEAARFLERAMRSPWHLYL